MDSPRKSDLYPPIRPYADGRLDVGGGHQLYFEQCGNPDGLPVVYLHGGPGAGSVAQHRRYFDPERYRVVLFDQRGSGRSKPFASVDANTTWDLVADIEALRRHLGVERWMVAGGSWGATLALAYGVSHPERCLGFLLRGVFLGTQAEIHWFLHGMGRLFPEAHDDFRGHVERIAGQPLPGDALFEAYAALLFDPSPSRHLPAALAWARYETRCSTLKPQDVTARGRAFDHYALSLARIEAHYFRHLCFLGPDELMRRLDAISHLPAHIVQGRYDIICPFETAYRLHQAWPGSRLHVVADAGHSAMEPGIARGLAFAADSLAGRLGKDGPRPHLDR